MSKQHDEDEELENKTIEEEKKDIIEELEDEIEEIEGIEDEAEEIEGGEDCTDDEIAKLKDLLARTHADLENFKKRTQRDREDMIFYLKSDIFKKIIPRIDDLERIVKNTPEDMQQGALFEGVLALEKSLKKDLDSMGVKPFESKGDEVDPHKHDVMTQVPGDEGIIMDEFEKGYNLGERILRHAKVVVGNGN